MTILQANYMRTLNLKLMIAYTNVTHMHHIQPVCNTQQDEKQNNTITGYLKYKTR